MRTAKACHFEWAGLPSRSLQALKNPASPAEAGRTTEHHQQHHVPKRFPPLSPSILRSDTPRRRDPCLAHGLEHSPSSLCRGFCHIKSHLGIWNQLDALALPAFDFHTQRRDLGHQTAAQAAIIFRVGGRGECWVVSRLHTASKRGIMTIKTGCEALCRACQQIQGASSSVPDQRLLE